MSPITVKRSEIAKQITAHVQTATFDFNSDYEPPQVRTHVIFKYHDLDLVVHDTFYAPGELEKAKAWLAWIFMFIDGSNERRGHNMMGYGIHREGHECIIHYRGHQLTSKAGLRACANLICKWWKLQEGK